MNTLRIYFCEDVSFMTDETVVLFGKFCDGDQNAATELFAKYFDRLDQFVGRRMSGRLQQRVGPDDIAQSVYRSFFQKAQEGIYSVTESGDLWRLLAFLADRRIQQKAEWHSAQKRDTSREQSMNAERSPGIAAQNSASQRADVDDAIDHVLNNICENWRQILAVSKEETEVKTIAERTGESETDVRKVLILRMRCATGMETEEIAVILNCSEVTVRRIWRNLLQFAESLASSSEEER